MNKQKCAIIGCGFVGATIAFALTQKSLFSELVLIDSNHAKARVKLWILVMVFLLHIQ